MVYALLVSSTQQCIVIRAPCKQCSLYVVSMVTYYILLYLQAASLLLARWTPTTSSTTHPKPIPLILHLLLQFLHGHLRQQLYSDNPYYIAYYISYYIAYYMAYIISYTIAYNIIYTNYNIAYIDTISPTLTPTTLATLTQYRLH